MSNTLLTTDMIADRALMILSEKLTFIPTINRDYDDSFGQKDAKIGDTLRVRVPQHGTVRHGKVMQPDPLVDVTTPVQIIDQAGIDLGYSSAELALDIDEIAERYLDQRMADLAIDIESMCLAIAYAGTPTQVGAPDGAVNSSFYALMAKKMLDDQLAPRGDRQMLLNTTAEVQMIGALQGLFNSQPDIAEQYREGRMGKALGFEWASSTVLPIQTSGSFAGTPVVSGANQTGTQIVTSGWTASQPVLNKGDIITFTGVYAVHAQTKQSLGYLRQFVVTAAVTSAASGTTTINVFPALTPTGPQQNVTASPAANAPILLAADAADTYGISMAYVKDFFVFATCDLPIPPKKDAARRMFEGISLRVVHDYDTRNDEFLARVDVMWGGNVVRPELAVRMANGLSLTPPS
jgi:hypothetical protein